MSCADGPKRSFILFPTLLLLVLWAEGGIRREENSMLLAATSQLGSVFLGFDRE